MLTKKGEILNCFLSTSQFFVSRTKAPSTSGTTPSLPPELTALKSICSLGLLSTETTLRSISSCLSLVYVVIESAC